MPPKKDESESEETESSETETDSTSESSSEEESPKRPQPKPSGPAAVPAKVPPAQQPTKAQPTPSQAPSQAPPSKVAPAPVTRGPVSNMPHDEEYDATDDTTHRSTPPSGAKRPTGANQPPSGRGGQAVNNQPHDEEYGADDGDHVGTPPEHMSRQRQQAGPAKAAGQKVNNAPHDEAFDAEDEGHAMTPPRVRQQGPGNNQQGKLVQNNDHDEEYNIDDEERTKTPENFKRGEASPVRQPQPAVNQQQQRQPQPQQVPVNNRKKSDSSSSSSSEEEEEETPKKDHMNNNGGGGGGGVQKVAPMSTGGTQPTRTAPTTTAPAASKELMNLNVSREIKDLFMAITSFQPVNVELNAKLIPFIPDYIPAVGDIDAFAKVPRPDGKPDLLGLSVVDEPCANQSNPAVVNIALGYQIKQQTRPTYVDSIEDAHIRPQAVERWIEDIRAIHAKNPPATVAYTKPMPDVEKLLQVWPQEMEDLLSQGALLPPAQLDVDLIQYVKIICAFLDIPTYGNLVESLHVMFTLFMEFKSNQHFQHNRM